MSKLLPATLLLGGVAILAFAFTLPTPLNTQVAAVGTTSTPSVSFTQEEVQTKEGATVYLKVKLNQPVTRTTKVSIKFTGDQGTSGRDVPGTKTLTYYPNGLTTKTLAIPTSRTTAQADKFLTATITKVGNTTVQGDTARIVVKDQKSVLATNQNTNTTTTTNTTPTDCKQYEGVIPGETRKLNVVQSPIVTVDFKKVYPSLSPEGLRDLALMQGDIGFAMGVGPMSSGGGWDRTRIPSGTVFSYKFKTTEYNYPVYYFLERSPNPETLVGVMGISVSECPGDFTSPMVLEQRSGFDVTNMYGDGKFRNCVSYGASAFGVFQFGAGGVNSDWMCALAPNKTYYLNITHGFMRDTDDGSLFPYMTRYGNDLATAGTKESVVDISMRPFGHMEADRQVWGSGVPNVLWTTEIIKNRSAFYSEMQRIRRLEAEASQRRIEACRAAIAAGRPCSSTR